jgi:hypothetical protein
VSLSVAACAGSGTPSAPAGPSGGPPAGSASPSAPVASPASTPVASAPATSPSAAASQATAGDAWRLVELPDSADAGQVADVVAVRDAVTAASAAGSAGERGIAWRSLDGGATWAAEALPGSAAGSLGRLVPWGDRMLALGEGEGGGACAHPSAVEVWVRSAAGHWMAAPFDPLFCAGGMATAATTTRAVIVGSGAGDVPYAWSSDDGLHWTDRSAPFAGRLPQGVGVDGTGFLAVGAGLGGSSAWAARSPDGVTWEAPRPIAGLSDVTFIGDPVAFEGRPALFATDPGGAVGIIRPDGHGGWRSDPCTGLRGDTVSRFVAAGTGLVALGGDERGPAMWASADGTTWHPLALPAEAVASGASATLTGAAVADGRAYLAGQILAASSDRAVGALWTGGASLLAP